MPRTTAEGFRGRIEEIERDSRATALAVALYDTATGTEFEYQEDRWFHAASTIKVPILVGVFGAIHRGELRPYSRLHVRNLFHSVVDGVPFTVDSGRDANSEVHQNVGKTMVVRDLARHMIATSSNLATNLLLDYLGVDRVRAELESLGLAEGIDLRRGVEDERAHAQGLNNRVTARGLSNLLRAVSEGRVFTPDLSRQITGILHAQEFRSGIPAPLPREARVAHKTGEISTVAHDAGIVYLPERTPYVLAVLSEWEPEATKRHPTIASVSYAAYEHLVGIDENGDG
ncbi:MAG TPA: serine hydrolase [Gemmatimonadaceae bacterium]|nr:serine hydrolase [Gemmatimonadaceae bacterium]